MPVIKGKDWAKKGARKILEELERLSKKQDRVILGLVGGRSVVPLYKELAKLNSDAWKKVHVFMVDERRVSIKSKDSNYKLAKTILEKKIKNWHPYRDEKGIVPYNNEFRREADAFDIVILSSGEDGHVGALYPDHHSIKVKEEKYFTMDDSPKPPPKRMTASRKMLEKAKVAFLLFIGEGKKMAYERFRSRMPAANCPCKLVKNIKRHYVLTDLN